MLVPQHLVFFSDQVYLHFMLCMCVNILGHINENISEMLKNPLAFLEGAAHRWFIDQHRDCRKSSLAILSA